MSDNNNLDRAERLQIMLDAEELAAVDDFRFQRRMPSRAAAVRELMKRGLNAEGFSTADSGSKSSSFGVLDSSRAKGNADSGARVLDSSRAKGGNNGARPSED